MKAFQLILIAGSLIGLMTGCQQTAIEGTVIDEFGQPLTGVSVKVIGTQFEDQTDNSGQYSVGYVPGEFTVHISKSGYSDTTFSVNIATESLLPIQTYPIYKMPEEKGIFFIDKEGYQPLTRLDIQKSQYSSGDYWNYETITSYFTTFLDVDVVAIQVSEKPLVFMDTDLVNQVLFRCLRNEEEEDVILEVSSKLASFGSQAQANTPAETYQIFKDGAAVRFVDLDPGNYIFVDYSERGGIDHTKPGYAFQVVD